MQFKQFNRAETGEDAGEKRENNWGGVLEGAGRVACFAHRGINVCQEEGLSFQCNRRKEGGFGNQCRYR